ncbi:MBL fold metallo-hydrolase [Streptomyces sp. F-3]|uniref:MBL fold metallo-hydrolase n=1 Tax=Streptomyces sp. F-3 TaxID=1840095 RepID=UPI00082E03FD|nr:MBL fold metallo-hydrolase [Streptomyces sp. F-3]
MHMNIQHIADGTYLVHGTSTNWVILTEGDAAALIDTGYPGDRQRLLDSLAAVGSSPEAVTAVLITHAHNDHLGSAEYLRAVHGTPVYLHEAEVPHARREFLHQVGVREVLRNSWRPGVLPWAVRALRVGGTAHIPVAAPRPFPTGGPLDLPGRPVPVHTPGHTRGHTVFHLPDAGVVISGDALVSGHPTSRIRGPQLLPDMFHHERAQALASLAVLERLDADVVLPGHGPAHRGPVRQAVRRAREHASRGARRRSS